MIKINKDTYVLIEWKTKSKDEIRIFIQIDFFVCFLVRGKMITSFHTSELIIFVERPKNNWFLNQIDQKLCVTHFQFLHIFIDGADALVQCSSYKKSFLLENSNMVLTLAVISVAYYDSADFACRRGYNQA